MSINRTNAIRLMLTDEENQTIQRRANRVGLSVQDYIRRLCIENAEVEVTIEEERDKPMTCQVVIDGVLRFSGRSFG